MPRSGTTLVCALLNEAPDTIALVEPIALERHGDRARAVAEIEAFIAQTRRTAVHDGLMMTKHVAGSISDNTAEPPTKSGLRRVLEQRGQIPVGKTLTTGFRLIIKHPAEFTALAGPLSERFPLYATVRHPLATLASWQTVDMPINRGRMPMAEAFVPELALRLDSLSQPLDRQVALIQWQLETYAELPRPRVLRYEDTLADPAHVLKVLSPQAGSIRAALQPVIPERRYAGVDLRRLSMALRPLTDLARLFYPEFEASLEAYIDQGLG